MRPSILVTGANGQLGQSLQALSSLYDKFYFLFTTKTELDITQKEDVENFFAKNNVDYCINCAAYTAVDKAEDEKIMAHQVNTIGVKNLAEICAKQKVKLIHISTDYVFDGKQTVPYKENSPTIPINEYGNSKLAGEKAVKEFNNEAIIIRTSWLYSEYGSNFVKTMIRLMESKESINVVNDQIGSPTYAASLAKSILQIILQIENGRNINGIYHYSSDASISWYDFALAIKEMIDSNCIINPILTSEYPTMAQRSPYSVLDKTKIQTEFGIVLRDWKEELKECIDKLKVKN